jgi:DMSO reductase anchor subunit
MGSVQKQSYWKLPALLNLTMGGMGAGYYLVALLIILPLGAEWLPVAVFKLTGPILVGLGLLALTTEAGHPLKSIYLFVNLRHSWMSREALAGVLFLLAAGIDWMLPTPFLRMTAAAAGLVFILAQGMIVWRASGVITWNRPVVPWFFLTCGLNTGAGLLLAVNALFGLPSILPIPWAAGLLALINLGIWLIYINTPGESFQHGVAPLHEKQQLFITLGVGHIIPLTLLWIGGLLEMPVFQLVAGVGLVFGGVVQKVSFTFKAGTMRDVVRR